MTAAAAAAEEKETVGTKTEPIDKQGPGKQNAPSSTSDTELTGEQVPGKENGSSAAAGAKLTDGKQEEEE